MYIFVVHQFIVPMPCILALHALHFFKTHISHASCQHYFILSALRFVAVDGDTSKDLIPDAAAVLLLDGTLRLNRSLASLLNNNKPKAQPAVVGGGPNNKAHLLGVDEASTGDAGLKLVSCAAAATCGGPGEPSSVDGTATVSRLVPFAPVGSKELQQVQFAPR